MGIFWRPGALVLSLSWLICSDFICIFPLLCDLCWSFALLLLSCTSRSWICFSFSFTFFCCYFSVLFFCALFPLLPSVALQVHCEQNLSELYLLDDGLDFATVVYELFDLFLVGCINHKISILPPSCLSLYDGQRGLRSELLLVCSRQQCWRCCCQQWMVVKVQCPVLMQWVQCSMLMWMMQSEQ